MPEDSKMTLSGRTIVSNRLLIVGLIFFAMFLIITGLVVSGVSQGWDASTALFINHLNLSPGVNSTMVLASGYGREYFWIPIVGLLLLFGKRDTKTLAIELAALFILGIVAGEAMKYLMYRPRPFETLTGIVTRVPVDTDSSYPSGHAIITSTGATFALVKFRAKGIAFILALEAVVVCFSRVYVGMHYPLDVVSGIFLAGFVVFAGAFVLERHLNRFVEALANLAQRVFGRGLVSV